MRLALVRRGFSATGGAEAYLRRFAGALADAGHTPVLYTSAAWPEIAWSHALRRVPAGASPLGFARALSKMQPRAECDLVFSLERVLACDCFRAGDGVHAAWLQRRAALEPFWKPLFRSWQPKHREIVQLESAMLRHGGAGGVIVNSRMVAEEITRNYGYPAERLHLVYNGAPPPLPLELRAAARAEVRRELGLSPDEYVLLFAGSGWDRKGLRQAMLAAQRAKTRPRLLIAGDGRRRGLPTCEKAIFLGGIQDLARHLAAADAFILPTLYDPFSNACLEAFAAGLPVITTLANGFAEIITPQEGDAVADPLDIAALAKAIDRWPPGAASVERLRSLASAYTVGRNLAETLQVLEGMISAQSATS